jgi:RNA polymerase sigma factor (TIGR02999 family)
MDESAQQVTQILATAGAGNPQAAQELLPLVYQELRRLAAHKMAQERPGQTLQPTALVHEAWLRLAGQQQQRWESRAQFFIAASEAMRRILVDRARRRQAAKHGGGLERVDVDSVELPIESDPDRLLRIHEALDGLAREEPLRADVVKLHCFVGMSHAEIAGVLNVSEKTVKRYWAYAKAWLRRTLET